MVAIDKVVNFVLKLKGEIKIVKVVDQAATTKA
jgi:hypothetical protein